MFDSPSSHLVSINLSPPLLVSPFTPALPPPPQCVVNFISELQEQMCRFQAEISTRIQEKKALEEKEAQQGDPRGHPAWGCGPHVGLAAPDPGLSGSDSWNQSGGQTVHVGSLDGYNPATLLPHHS